MEKSIFTAEYNAILRKLRALRREKGVSQAVLAERLGQTQSFISKCERGERRMDIVEVHQFCRAIGISFLDFIRDLDIRRIRPRGGRR